MNKIKDFFAFIFNKIKDFLSKHKYAIYRLLYLVFSVAAAYLLFVYKEAFSAFGASLLIDLIAISLVIIWDKLTPDFDIKTELKNGNIAVGLALIAYAIIIGSSNIAAFVVYR